MSYRRQLEDKRRMQKLYNKAHTHYISGVYFDSDKNRYVKCENSNQSKTRKYFQTLSNKKVRRNRKIMPHGQYKKVYDLWWNLY